MCVTRLIWHSFYHCKKITKHKSSFEHFSRHIYIRCHLRFYFSSFECDVNICIAFWSCIAFDARVIRVIELLLWFTNVAPYPDVFSLQRWQRKPTHPYSQEWKFAFLFSSEIPKSPLVAGCHSWVHGSLSDKTREKIRCCTQVYKTYIPSPTIEAANWSSGGSCLSASETIHTQNWRRCWIKGHTAHKVNN